MARGLTQEQAAHAWGVSQNHISRLIRDGKIKKREDGSVDAVSLKEWGLKREAEKQAKTGGDANGSDTLNLQYQRARKEKAQADKLEDELREKRGELVLYDQVHQMQADMYARLRSHVRAAFAKVPTALGLPQKQHDAARKILAGLERDMLLAVAETEDDDDEQNEDG